MHELWRILERQVRELAGGVLGQPQEGSALYRSTEPDDLRPMVMASEPALHGAGHASALISWLEKYLDTSIELRSSIGRQLASYS